VLEKLLGSTRVSSLFSTPGANSLSRCPDDRLRPRFATYKRAGLILADIEKPGSMVTNPKRPVQFVFAGKAIRMTNPASACYNRSPTHA